MSSTSATQFSLCMMPVRDILLSKLVPPCGTFSWHGRRRQCTYSSSTHSQSPCSTSGFEIIQQHSYYVAWESQFPSRFQPYPIQIRLDKSRDRMDIPHKFSGIVCLVNVFCTHSSMRLYFSVWSPYE